MPTNTFIQDIAARAAEKVYGKVDQLSLFSRLAIPGMLLGGVVGGSKLYEYLSSPDFEDIYALAQAGEETPLDMDEAHKAYKTLMQFAPQLAGDPMTAAAFIRRAARYGTINIEEIARLIDAQETMRKTKLPGAGISEVVSNLGRLLTRII